MEHQDLHIKSNVVYRGNQSTINLGENGKASSGKRTRYFNIKYLFITYSIKQKIPRIEYCPTYKMAADYMAKLLTGPKFEQFRNIIMKQSKKLPIVQQEYVGYY